MSRWGRRELILYVISSCAGVPASLRSLETDSLDDHENPLASVLSRRSAGEIGIFSGWVALSLSSATIGGGDGAAWEVDVGGCSQRLEA
jgi:hypothetical protein